VFGYCIVVSLTAFSVICNKTFYKVYTLLSHTPHHTKSPLGSRGRDSVKRQLIFKKTLDVLAFAKFLRQQFQEEKISELLEANGISLHSQKTLMQ